MVKQSQSILCSFTAKVDTWKYFVNWINVFVGANNQKQNNWIEVFATPLNLERVVW